MSAIGWHLLPDSAVVNRDGELEVGGCLLSDLAAKYGTPLFVYDEAHLRTRCREAVAAFGRGTAYAAKAFLCVAMAKLAHEEGLHIDVASGGELYIALAAGVPPSQLIMHGNNKSVAELSTARRVGVGRIVVDSFDELDRLECLYQEDHLRPRILLRLNPGVEAHTHEFLRTGQTDSKFGFGLASGAATDATERSLASPAVELVGFHAHVGSQIFVADFYRRSIGALAPFVRQYSLPELSIGGGIGAAYVNEDRAVSMEEWATAIKAAVSAYGIKANVVVEPGRAIAAQAGITLYTVGTIKNLPGIRTYVSIDGGMSDNLRPLLYGSTYEAFVPRIPLDERTCTVSIAGQHCESGDVIIRDASVSNDLVVGDVLAVPVTGAYGHAMASNYNKVRRPAVVFVSDGAARVVVRRETYADLITCDMDYRANAPAVDEERRSVAGDPIAVSANICQGGGHDGSGIREGRVLKASRDECCATPSSSQTVPGASSQSFFPAATSD